MIPFTIQICFVYLHVCVLNGPAKSMNPLDVGVEGLWLPLRYFFQISRPFPFLYIYIYIYYSFPSFSMHEPFMCSLRSVA